MKTAILFLVPLALAYGCSKDQASETHAAASKAAAHNTPSTSAAKTPAPAGTASSKASDSGLTKPNAGTAADNTKINERDRGDDTLTPTDQKENAADLALTQKVRQALVADDTLSINAQNIKIISQDGTVTLRGPVKDHSEKDKIETKAKAVAGVAHVDNQLEIKGP